MAESSRGSFEYLQVGPVPSGIVKAEAVWKELGKPTRSQLQALAGTKLPTGSDPESVRRKHALFCIKAAYAFLAISHGKSRPDYEAIVGKVTFCEELCYMIVGPTLFYQLGKFPISDSTHRMLMAIAEHHKFVKNGFVERIEGTPCQLMIEGHICSHDYCIRTVLSGLTAPKNEILFRQFEAKQSEAELALIESRQADVLNHQSQTSQLEESQPMVCPHDSLPRFTKVQVDFDETIDDPMERVYRNANNEVRALMSLLPWYQPPGKKKGIRRTKEEVVAARQQGFQDFIMKQELTDEVKKYIIRLSVLPD